ncbi:hypothetical protein K435DRAFT_810481 [Dendrothele bispora CBS 962.96]|uniref:Protein kinase domain-containing protein n=1 Tax=Dendrothele bispora (strain CBS 962.96) TaxID=1314807 RepID=A0A4S8KV93_DENBC|nr:hypothetical protein K435DRAFT_810481 [Dendrothele bispora CBS 962.96]
MVKIIAFELDDTLWRGQLDEKRFGKGRNASPVSLPFNALQNPAIETIFSSPQNQIELFPDTPLIINDILRKGIQIAIVSRNPNKALCTRALFYYKARDAKDQVQPITSLITYNEVKNESKMYPFERIKNWSGVPYEEMLLFDSSSSSVQEKLDGQPPLGKLLGGGRFASVYDSAEDSEAVIKVMKYWERGLRKRFLEIYQVIKEGKPFKPGNDNDDQYLTMLAFELRNLNMIKELKAPKPENFTGWFMSTKIFGTALWKTPLYKQHPFSVPFQRLIKKAFHLIVDEIEETVRKYGVEHRDGHLANALFTMNGDQPAKAHLLDWGIAVRMQWDGKRYIRGDDVLVWAESESGAKRYWITWMVKTEYEANVRRNAITEEDSKKFLKDLTWWFQR